MTDDIRLGFTNSSDPDGPGTILIKNYKFGLVENQQDIFNIFEFDAIVGLAYDKIAQKGIVPLFDDIMSKKLLKHNLFAFYMTSENDEKQLGQKSQLTIGSYDKSKIFGQVDWYPIVNKNMYQIAIDDILIGNKSYGMCKDKNCTLALDSGTTFMSVPPYARDIMIKNEIPIGGKSQPCNNVNQWGNIDFIIKGKKYSISPAEYMFETFNATIKTNGVEH